VACIEGCSFCCLRCVTRPDEGGGTTTCGLTNEYKDEQELWFLLRGSTTTMLLGKEV